MWWWWRHSLDSGLRHRTSWHHHTETFTVIFPVTRRLKVPSIGTFARNVPLAHVNPHMHDVLGNRGSVHRCRPFLVAVLPSGKEHFRSVEGFTTGDVEWFYISGVTQSLRNGA